MLILELTLSLFPQRYLCEAMAQARDGPRQKLVRCKIKKSILLVPTFVFL